MSPICYVRDGVSIHVACEPSARKGPNVEPTGLASPMSLIPLTFAANFECKSPLLGGHMGAQLKKSVLSLSGTLSAHQAFLASTKPSFIKQKGLVQNLLNTPRPGRISLCWCGVGFEHTDP